MASVFNHLKDIEEAVSNHRFGLITDIDGTISPTTATPSQATVSPAIQSQLAALCHSLSMVAVISGRAVADARRLVGLEDIVYMGNHGLERWVEGQTELTHTARDCPLIIKTALGELNPLLAGEDILIEDKGASAAIHYRTSAHPETTHRHIMAAINKSEKATQLRAVPGRMSVNLIPQLEMNKGTAVLELIIDYNLSAAVYIGDEPTDIDAFKAVRKGNGAGFKGIAIAVLSEEAPPELAEEANYTLKDVAEVEKFLKWLAATAGQEK